MQVVVTEVASLEVAVPVVAVLAVAALVVETVEAISAILARRVYSCR